MPHVSLLPSDTALQVGNFEDCTKCENQFTVVHMALYMHAEMTVKLISD